MDGFHQNYYHNFFVLDYNLRNGLYYEIISNNQQLKREKNVCINNREKEVRNHGVTKIYRCAIRENVND